MKLKPFMICLIIFLAFSCEGDNLLTYRMSAFIDGDTWKTVTPITILKNGYINIIGTDGKGRVINITIKGTTEGEYSLTGANAECIYKASLNATPEDSYVGISGTVTLTDVNSAKNKISGEFDFLCSRLTEQVSITNGQFTNITYTEQ